jgi:pyruvate kinase
LYHQLTKTICLRSKKLLLLIVEDGGLTSHAAVVGIAQDIPVIVGAKGATTTVTDGELSHR